MLPTFLIIGAMKSGTTSLHTYLSAHPQVFMSELKELDYFNNPERTLDWYLEQFAPAEGRSELRAIGESSPNYTKFGFSPGVPQRIHALIPDVKMIYVMRDPIARIKSHYRHLAREGSVHRSLDYLVRRHEGFLHTSSYAAQLEKYFEVFDRDQILLLMMEELDPGGPGLAKIHDFLGLDPVEDAAPFPHEWSSPEPLRTPTWKRLVSLNRRSLSMDLAPETEQMLRDRLAPDVAALRAWLPADFDGWGIA